MIIPDGPSGALEMGECPASYNGASGELCRRGNISFLTTLDDGLTRTGAVWRGAGCTTIDDIPENILLDIFDFYRIFPNFPQNVYSVWEWHVLAQVCRKWRQVLFTSPRRLDLQLHCTPNTPVRKLLDVWPPLPITIEKAPYIHLHSEADEDNLVAALEHRDRVTVITISGLTCRQLESVAAMMQEPFPALTRLHLGSMDGASLPDIFMGGSAPRLQRLDLVGISFPTLPRLVLSPTDLTALNLHAIPRAGYISPVEMVAYLSPLTMLSELVIEFESPHPPPDPSSRRVIPSTRALLPALLYFRFKGVVEYLEDVVSQIDAPVLFDLEATIFNQLTFAIPRLSQFINRTERLKSLNQAELSFDSRFVEIKFRHDNSLSLLLHIPCSPSDWQLSSVIQLCGPPLPLPSSVERLDICEGTTSPQKWQYDTDHEPWLEILIRFTSLRELYVSHTMWPLLAPALKHHTGEGTLNLLPMLCDVFLEKLEPSEPLPEAIGRFVAARKLTDHPVVVHRKEGETRTWKAVDLDNIPPSRVEIDA